MNIVQRKVAAYAQGVGNVAKHSEQMQFATLELL